jgi:acyl carrier protein
MAARNRAPRESAVLMNQAMTTAERVRKIIATFGAVDAASLTDSATFDALGVDSLDLIEIVMGIENEFGFDIPDVALEQLCTVGDAIRYVEQHAPTGA